MSSVAWGVGMGFVGGLLLVAIILLTLFVLLLLN